MDQAEPHDQAHLEMLKATLEYLGSKSKDEILEQYKIILSKSNSSVVPTMVEDLIVASKIINLNFEAAVSDTSPFISEQISYLISSAKKINLLKTQRNRSPCSFDNFMMHLSRIHVAFVYMKDIVPFLDSKKMKMTDYSILRIFF